MDNRKIIIRSLIEGGIGWVVLAGILSMMHSIPFVQALVAPHTILIAISAIVGSCIGYRRRAQKQSKTQNTYETCFVK